MPTEVEQFDPQADAPTCKYSLSPQMCFRVAIFPPALILDLSSFVAMLQKVPPEAAFHKKGLSADHAFLRATTLTPVTRLCDFSTRLDCDMAFLHSHIRRSTAENALQKVTVNLKISKKAHLPSSD